LPLGIFPSNSGSPLSSLKSPPSTTTSAAASLNPHNHYQHQYPFSIKSEQQQQHHFNSLINKDSKFTFFF
jgi:hypothetical protein